MKESYTIYELAEAWHCSWKTVWRMIRRERVKAFKLNGTWRIKHEERVKVEQSGLKRLTA